MTVLMVSKITKKQNTRNIKLYSKHNNTIKQGSDSFVLRPRYHDSIRALKVGLSPSPPPNPPPPPPMEASILVPPPARRGRIAHERCPLGALPRAILGPRPGSPGRALGAEAAGPGPGPIRCGAPRCPRGPPGVRAAVPPSSPRPLRAPP